MSAFLMPIESNNKIWLSKQSIRSIYNSGAQHTARELHVCLPCTINITYLLSTGFWRNRLPWMWIM